MRCLGTQLNMDSGSSYKNRDENIMKGIVYGGNDIIIDEIGNSYL